MKKMYNKFFPEDSETRQQEFANQLPAGKLSMAKLQGHFLRFKNSS
jgi:hypothetical protein